ncbi:MAG: hypothetical protein HFF17_07770 [Oscillospiraceae bacterium]|nr:hypothetical protein [Oscillospiraceae bacterium]
MDIRWVSTIFATTVVISACFSFLSDSLLDRVQLAAAFAVLFLIVLVGILFDIIGVAVTTADEKPFHSMAARNVPEAREAIRLIRNANRVSSICNDVVGDICGIISGSAAAMIAAQVIASFTPTAASFFRLLLSAVVSALTVGGKAVGKTFAINASTPIVHFAAKLIYRVKYFFKWLRNLFRSKDR